MPRIEKGLQRIKSHAGPTHQSGRRKAEHPRRHTGSPYICRTGQRQQHRKIPGHGAGHGQEHVRIG